MLSRGASGVSVMTVAQDLLTRFGSLAGVVSASLEDLQEVLGLGPVKALQLQACLEIARRVSNEDEQQEMSRNASKAVALPEDVAKLIKPKIRDFNKEHFFVVSFDNRNRVLGIDHIATGTINSNLVHPRETFEVAIRRHATHIAVAHNHPSGEPQPSDAGFVVTQSLSKAGKLMGIQLLDHIILSKTQLYSFKENNLL